MRRSVRFSWAMVVVVMGLSACKDNGLPDRNLPLEAARTRVFGYPVYQASPIEPAIAAAGQTWIRSFTVETIPDRLLVQVANADGTLLYARRDEQTPFAILYTPVSTGRWAPYLRLN